jgi:hypothetical protein
MSHFILGIITTSDGCKLDQISPLLGKFAVKHQLTLTFLSRENDGFQYEILKTAKDDITAANICFEFVGLSGTADELISPYRANVDWPESLQVLFKNLNKFIQELVTVNEIKTVMLVFTEGYDTAYEVVKCTVDILEQILFNKFKIENRVPSLAIVIDNINYD